MKLSRLFLIVLGWVILSAQAEATVILYNNKTAFLSDVGSISVNLRFDELAPDGSVFVFDGTPPRNYGGITLASDLPVTVVGQGYAGLTYGGAFAASTTANTIIFTGLPAGINALGFDFGSVFPGGSIFNVLLSTGENFAVSSSGSILGDDLGFAGFISSAAITSFNLILPSNANYHAADNIIMGVAVPEPGSISLSVLGLIALARIKTGRA